MLFGLNPWLVVPAALVVALGILGALFLKGGGRSSSSPPFGGGLGH